MEKDLASNPLIKETAHKINSDISSIHTKISDSMALIISLSKILKYADKISRVDFSKNNHTLSEDLPIFISLIWALYKNEYKFELKKDEDSVEIVSYDLSLDIGKSWREMNSLLSKNNLEVVDIFMVSALLDKEKLLEVFSMGKRLSRLIDDEFVSRPDSFLSRIKKGLGI